METFKSQKRGNLSKIITEKYAEISYSLVRKLLRKKDIKVNSVRVNADVKVEVGDLIEIYYLIEKIESFSIVFYDQNILVIDKKSGFTSEQVFSDLKEKFSEIYFIHRLDRNTSGIMIFAINVESEKELLLGFRRHAFIKEYLAEVIGFLDKKEDILTAYLVKDSENSLVKIYSKNKEGGALIKTGYKVLKTLKNSSILRVRLHTGKTHQIRAHLAYIGHPIIGDNKYGDVKINEQYKTKHQRLIAKYLTLKFSDNSLLFYLNDKTFISSFSLGEL